MSDYQEPTYAEVNRDILETLLVTGPKYWILFGITTTIALVCFFGPWMYQLYVGVGGSSHL